MLLLKRRLFKPADNVTTGHVILGNEFMPVTGWPKVRFIFVILGSKQPLPIDCEKPK